MPYKKSSVQKKIKRKKRFTLNKRSKNNRSRRRQKLKLSTLFLYIILPLIFLSLLYISVLSIIRIRQSDDGEETEVQFVIGIDGVPTYPRSEFIFLNNIDNTSVANFISSGNSAYRIPLNKSLSDIYEYYQEILPEYGWTHVLSVEVGSEEMKSGEYWIKDDKGLRIYSKFDDIWYEQVTPVQAYSGLRDRVQREIERDLLLASQDTQDLLPDYPWVIDIPKEYIITYRTSDFDNLRIVEFRKIGTEERVSVTPIGKAGGVLDNYLVEYVDILNKHDEENWTINNTVLSYTEYGRSLRGTIAFDGRINDIAVIPNTYNGVIYVMDGNTKDDPFFDYVYSNLKPQGLKID